MLGSALRPARSKPPFHRAVPNPRHPLWPQLVLCCLFNESGGTTYYDLTRKIGNGTGAGGVGVAALGAGDGAGLTLSGAANTYVTWPLAILNINDAFTVLVRARLNQTAAALPFFQVYDQFGNHNMAYVQWMTTDNGILTQDNLTSGDNTNSRGISQPINLQVFHTYAFSHDGSLHYPAIAIDGSGNLAATSSNSLTVPGSGNVGLSLNQASTPAMSVSLFAIIHRALSTAEASQITANPWSLFLEKPLVSYSLAPDRAAAEPRARRDLLFSGGTG